ncbi:hypothetical protein E4T39_06091 [Aureobasidium subglaciale]|nr:hypothetical protein E4T39_06091 [Aureobasidium subglaciale]
MANLSYGRGGAGNMAPASPNLPPTDLKTPTIKSSTYTTGRGGQGNMQPNVHPDITRQTQDVEAHPRAGREPEKNFQWGRGGAGNTASLSKDQIVDIAARNASRQRAEEEERKRNPPASGGESMDQKPKKENKGNVMGHMLQRVMSKGQ